VERCALTATTVRLFPGVVPDVLLSEITAGAPMSGVSGCMPPSPTAPESRLARFTNLSGKPLLSPAPLCGVGPEVFPSPGEFFSPTRHVNAHRRLRLFQWPPLPRNILVKITRTARKKKSWVRRRLRSSTSRRRHLRISPASNHHLLAVG